MKREITIAGGGLAGLSLGIALRRTGIPVTIHEAGAYPRHRVCGEFISGVTPSTLEDLGIRDLLPDAPDDCGAAWFYKGRKILRMMIPAPVYRISRWKLDHALKERFESLGGTLCEHSRLLPDSREGLVWAAGRVRRRRSVWIGLKCHARNLEMTEDLEMHLGSNGYAGLARVEDGKVNVCGLFRTAPSHTGKSVGLLGEYLNAGGNTKLAERLAGAGTDASSFCGVAGFSLGRQSGTDGVTAIGDAESMIPPFTGNGMSMAFQAAALAAPVLAKFHTGGIGWAAAGEKIRRATGKTFRRRMLFARLMQTFMTSTSGQPVLAALANHNALPSAWLMGLVR